MAVIANMAERFIESRMNLLTGIQCTIVNEIYYVLKRFSSSVRAFFFSFLFQA